MLTKSSEMVFIFSVVLKIFLTSLPLRDARYILETVPSDDQNNNLQARLGKKYTYMFTRSYHCYTFLIQLLLYTAFFSLTTVLPEPKLIIKQKAFSTHTDLFQENPVYLSLNITLLRMETFLTTKHCLFNGSTVTTTILLQLFSCFNKQISIRDSVTPFRKQ